MGVDTKAVILFVDNEIDSPGLKPVLVALNKKYRVLTSRTLEDAEIKFKYDTDSIDMVILDIHFGGAPYGGLKLLESMRKIDPYLPIGMITQYDKTSRAFQAGQNLASFYLPKPETGIDSDFVDKLSTSIEDSLRNVEYLYDRQ